MNNKIQNTAIILLALALQKTYDDFQLLDYGFNQEKCYVDFSVKQTISINEFKEIEKAMKKLIAANPKIESKENNHKTTAKVNNFEINLHDKNIGTFANIKFYKLLQIGGIENHNVRINFCAFEQKTNYENYLAHLEDMEQRDHRKIGKEMSIFCFSNEVGQGLPMFLPNGAFIKDKISRYLKDICLEHGFKIVSTPILGSKHLYQTSGHWDLYKENNFPPINVDDETYMLRPMTCPHHMIVFKNDKKTYKDLPLAFCEDSILHRYESSGGLIGLERVRSMELFDTHIFVRANQIEAMVNDLYQMILKVYDKLEIKIDQIDLSLRSNEKAKFFDDDQMWNVAENQLKNTLDKMKLEYQEVKGEAAFYGPKIDFQYRTTHDKLITISTIQLDFLLPKKFELEYLNENEEKEIPIIIHLGLIGTYERFISCLLSQAKGALPLWLAFSQATIIPVNNNYHLEYARQVEAQLLKANIRVKIDDSDERMAKKIRNAQVNKVPFQIIIGDEERDQKTIGYRRYGQKETTIVTINDFIKLFV